MFFVFLMRILRGWVRISVRGGFPERFLNLCAYRGIQIWSLKRDDGVMYGSVMAHAYPSMRDIARKTGVKLRLAGKTGLPFIFFRYRRRPGIPIGCVIFFGFLVFMSRFIWCVEFSGAPGVNEQNVRESLRTLGLSVGTEAKSVNPAAMRIELLLRHKELAWASINLQGSFAFVELREAEKKPSLPQTGAGADIRAKADGRIIRMEVYEGTAMAQKGEAVLKGDLLVSGKIEYASGESAVKHARAKIIAETERSLSESIPLRQVVTRKTGETATRRVLSVFGVRIPLYIGSVKGEYELKTSVEPLILDGVRLPIILGTGIYSFTEQHEVKYTQEQAVALAKKKIAAREKAELSEIEIKSRKEIVENNGDWVKLTIHYSCVENISVEEILLINDGK